MEVLLKSFILVVSLAAQTGALELLVIGEGKDMIETRKVTMVLLFIAIQLSSFIYLLILFFNGDWRTRQDRNTEGNSTTSFNCPTFFFFFIYLLFFTFLVVQSLFSYVAMTR